MHANLLLLRDSRSSIYRPLCWCDTEGGSVRLSGSMSLVSIVRWLERMLYFGDHHFGAAKPVPY